MVIGRDAIMEALINGESIERIYIENNAKGAAIDEIKGKAQLLRIPVNYVPAAKLNSFNVAGHEGCIALKSKIIYVDLANLIAGVFDNGQAPLFLVLDGITDIRNIGGIARTAYCMGAHGIIIPDKGVGALNEDALITSAGALEKIAICRVNSLMKTVDELHAHGIRVFATEMTGERVLYETDLTVPAAIIMGSEDKGIYPALRKICDEQIKIPMNGDFESLNVSVATGMVLYETYRQRANAG